MNVFFSCLYPVFVVYNVAGLCSYDLFEEINFEEWFSRGLVKEVQNKSPKYSFIFLFYLVIQRASVNE